MSIKALFSRRASLPDPQKITTPLGERFPGENIGYVSTGPAGTVLAKVELPRGAGPIVRECRLVPTPESARGRAELLTAFRKGLTGGFGRSIPACVVGCTCDEWQIKRSIQAKDQEAFAHSIRVDPQAVLGTPTDGYVYTGLLQESTSTALVLGAPQRELAALEAGLAAARAMPVRRTMPVLAAMNLLLADDRVTKERMIPLVADQGSVVAVVTGDTGWGEVFGRRLLGQGYTVAALPEVLQQISHAVGTPRFLTAISDANGDAQIEKVIRDSGASVTSYSVGGLSPNELFAYACSIL